MAKLIREQRKKIKNIENHFITSDFHFNHYNTIKFSKKTRPFNNTEEMNEALIKEWNSKINKDSIVYFVGDFMFKSKNGVGYSFEELMEKLNGNIVFIEGNHDNIIRNKIKNHSVQILNLSIKTEDINETVSICHYPIIEWNRKFHGGLHLFGHLHGNKKQIAGVMGGLVDVGFDAHGKILTLKEAIKLAQQKRDSEDWTPSGYEHD